MVFAQTSCVRSATSSASVMFVFIDDTAYEYAFSHFAIFCFLLMFTHRKTTAITASKAQMITLGFFMFILLSIFCFTGFGYSFLKIKPQFGQVCASTDTFAPHSGHTVSPTPQCGHFPRESEMFFPHFGHDINAIFVLRL